MVLQMGWLEFLGVTSSGKTELSELQCFRALSELTDLESEFAQQLIETLETLTGHPDIRTYLENISWQEQSPVSIRNDLLAEVRLLNQLIRNRN